MYRTSGQLAVYNKLIITLFISGYLAGMKTIKSAIKPLRAKHMKELMGNTDVYVWPVMRLYHTVWLQQLKNGHASWSDAETKLNFRCALVWNATSQHSALGQKCLLQLARRVPTRNRPLLPQWGPA